jgi:hypothetical protein
MAYDINQVEEAFDKLTAKVKAELDVQFNKGRIKGTDYTTVYSTLMNTVLQLCVDIPLKDKQVEKLDQDTKNSIAQEDQIKRQTQAFDDNLRFKLFDTQMKAWSDMFSSGMLETLPNIISNDEATTMYNDIKNSIR